MRARDIMTRPVVVLRPETSIRHAAAVLTGRRIAAAPVVGRDGELVGILSQDDLVTDPPGGTPWWRCRSSSTEPIGPAPPQVVADLMARPAVVMPASADAAEVAQAMIEHGVYSVPVVSGSVLVGIVSWLDVLRVLIGVAPAAAAAPPRPATRRRSNTSQAFT